MSNQGDYVISNWGPKPDGFQIQTQFLSDGLTTEDCLIDVAYLHPELDVTVGTDRGILHVTDGWLVFEGERTRFSFAWSPAVTLPQELDNSPVMAVRVSGVDGIRMRMSDIKGMTAVVPKPIGKTLSEWRGQARSCTGTSVLPPLTCDPDLLKQQSRAAAIYLVVSGVLLGPSIVLTTLVTNTLGFGSLLTCGLLLLLPVFCVCIKAAFASSTLGRLNAYDRLAVGERFVRATLDAAAPPAGQTTQHP